MNIIDVSDGINDFESGSYTFLSNFYPVEITYGGLTFKNSEAAFQAQKVLDEEEKLQFTDLAPGKAKRRGRQVKLRPDWEDVKESIMYEVVKAKFNQHTDLLCKLLSTGDTPLYEGNTWNDTYWGVCSGEGRNVLGKILMRVRDELKNGCV